MLRTVRKIEPLAARLPSKKRVAAYARVSSGKDAMLHSLSAQVSYYSDFIQKHRGWEYAGVYADEAVTGTKESRAEFQRLLKDCRNGKIDMVITKSISRFARNTVTMLEAVRELKSLEVDVFFEKENIHSMSGDGELMLTILASFAQEESRSVSENCKWRIRKRFAEGEIVNLRFLFGYHIKNGEIEINPEEAEVVEMIFNDYISGMGCTLIAKKLRGMNVDRPRGGTWTSNKVADIIKNEKYAGNALLQKKYVDNHLTKSLLKNKGVLPKYYAEETHASIIDPDTFQKAQEIMDRNRKRNAGKNVAGVYPFTSKIVCTNCGKNYKRKNRKGKASWSCSTYLKLGKEACNARQIPEDILLSIATEVLELQEFDDTYFLKQIKEIQVLEHNLVRFVFQDGQMIDKQWQHKSRSESWSEEDREKARMRQLDYLERRNSICSQQEQ
ncbi:MULTISPECIES: recombinase family protein [Pseudobacteroides]|uniref:Resolvase domain-containing protein n=1 Tax=Pseudobacteroides cellulosolvens ATCC 35603 = DSM 2933 TaxID=398512 RepID=A0A0L6JT31_9FIRM|nr:recombinase family protein [Pseudobacteroides cellulosolvens]KNY29006.1 Resolvase domain-containing protein [Pseudobacteroides cellulosolvens ATCC 35603 = DSM 2933]